MNGPKKYNKNLRKIAQKKKKKCLESEMSFLAGCLIQNGNEKILIIMRCLITNQPNPNVHPSQLYICLV